TSISCPVTGVLTRMRHSLVCKLPCGGRALYIIVIAFNAGHRCPRYPYNLYRFLLKAKDLIKAKDKRMTESQSQQIGFMAQEQAKKKSPSMTGRQRSSAALRPAADSAHESADAPR